MVEYFIQDIKESLPKSSHKLRHQSLVNPSKKPFTKFVRQDIVDNNYLSQIYEKDKLMSHYHQILEKTLNSSIQLNKNPESQFTKPKSTWLSKTKTASEVLQKYEEDLIKYLTPSKDQNSMESRFGCENLTFKLLFDMCAVKSLILPVPETLVNGNGFDSTTFIYNDSKGAIQFLQKLNLRALDLVVKIFSKKRTFNERVIGPVAIARTSYSEGNKVFMRSVDIQHDLKNIHKNDLLIQEFVLPKGNLCNKFRIVFRDGNLRVFVVTGKKRFDRSVYKEKGINVKKEEEFEKESRLDTEHSRFPTLKYELSKALSQKTKVFNRTSISLVKEKRFNTLEEFMDAVQPEFTDIKLEVLYYNLWKVLENPGQGDHVHYTDDIIHADIINTLRKMFCTYSKTVKSSSITEIKSQKTCEPLSSLFSYLKDALNSIILRPQNLKISELICDFFEDSSKKLFLSKIKSCRCVNSNSISIKSIFEKKEFKCPGKYCSQKIDANECVTDQNLVKKKNYPKKCWILRGVLMGEEDDGVKELNYRVFERVQVCEVCFVVYNEAKVKVDEQESKVKVLEHSKTQAGPAKNVYRKNVNREKLYLEDVGKKLHKYTAQVLSNKLIKEEKKKRSAKSFSFFDAKRKSIHKALQIEEFCDSSVIINPSH